MPISTAADRSSADGLREDLRHPTLRSLLHTTAVRSLGRGLFLTLSALYLTRVAGLSTAQMALLLLVANGCGVVASYAGGHVADRVPPRALVAAGLLLEAVGFLGYAVARDQWVVAVTACLIASANRGGATGQATLVATAFTGPMRVRARAVQRSVNNIGIGVGSLLASLPLAADTPAAYRVTLGIAACLYVLAAATCRRLPRLAPRVHAASHAHDRERSPFRDPRFLTLSALNALFAVQFALAEVGVPLWVVNHTAVPHVMVSVLLALNTAIVTALQVPLSRGSDQVPHASKLYAWAGLLVLAACLLLAVSSGRGVSASIALLVVAEITLTMAEILSSAAGWGLSYELQPASRAGAYQGVFAMGMAIGQMIGPAVVTATALTHGLPGWTLLGLLFASVGTGVWLLGIQATRTPSPPTPTSGTRP